MKKYSWILIISGIVGMLMSFTLTMDKIELLQNPEAVLPCNINPVISCGSVINKPQASVFGFPNPILGLAGFTGVFTIGVLLLSGIAVLNKKLLTLLLIGNTFAILFIHWLIYQSLFVIGALCLYCMITWIFTWPLFFFTFINYLKLKGENFITKNHLPIFITWYFLIIFLILFQFKDFFFE